MKRNLSCKKITFISWFQEGILGNDRKSRDPKGVGGVSKNIIENYMGGGVFRPITTLFTAVMSYSLFTSKFINFLNGKRCFPHPTLLIFQNLFFSLNFRKIKLIIKSGIINLLWKLIDRTSINFIIILILFTCVLIRFFSSSCFNIRLWGELRKNQSHTSLYEFSQLSC